LGLIAAGWRKSDEGRRIWWLVDIISGILAGVVGGWLFGCVGFGRAEALWLDLVAFVGAVILVWITRHVEKGRS